MRLHRLELSAFLAFPGREAIDFDALGAAGLFLLHGRTGAGKTSLLDAVCFAFYGDVPGARQEGGRLRSDHAAPETPTEVVLEATLRGRRIRITRVPAHERPKKVGDGTTTEPHRVRVVAVEEDGTETVLATRHEEARLELGALLGLTREQFCQVVLLPQGGFARFLHARSDEREALLRDLFDLGRFADAEQWLRNRRIDAERVARAAMGAVRDAVSRSAQVVEAEPPEGWEDAPELAARWVDEQLVVTEASAATAQVACREARERRRAADAALTAAIELAAHRQRHERAAAELAAWEGRRPARDAAVAELDAARRAAPAGALVEALDDRDDAAAVARSAADAALAAAAAAGVPGLTDAADAAALRATAAALRRDAGAADALLAREAAVEAAAAAVGELEAVAAREGAEAERLVTAIAAAEQRRPELEAQVRAAADAAAGLGGLRAAAELARARATQGAERDRRAAEAGAARAALLDAREAAVSAQEAHAALQRRRLDGIAAELAAGLADGEPCAVCGSSEHPAPAAAPDGGVVDEARVAAAHAEAERLVAAREAVAESLAALESAIAAARAVAGDAPQAELEAAAAAADADLAAAEEAAAAAPAAERALRELCQGLEAATARRVAVERAAGTAAAEARQRAAALAADREAVDAGRAGAPTLAVRIDALATAAAAAERAAAALDASATAAREAARARAGVARAAAEAGFGDLAALRSAARAAGACADLEARVRRYDEGLAARGRLAAAACEELANALARFAAVAVAAPAADAAPSAGAAPTGIDPDLPAIEAAAAAAGAVAEQAQGALVLVQRRHTELQALRGRLEDALAAAGPARERHALVRELAELAAGSSASNRLRMRLSAYVLAARLEEVAAAATVRLQRMSGGRYALEHADDGARGNRRGGLDLRVVDAWTGRDRPPSTLSGGETFLASLALALGLADVVAAEAGGARLDTLFVDEGFGSLDDEGTLDEVLEVLDALRDGGRAVGIVSHVAELRQRIPAQLRVERGRAGSRVLAPAAPAV